MKTGQMDAGAGSQTQADKKFSEVKWIAAADGLAAWAATLPGKTRSPKGLSLFI